MVSRLLFLVVLVMVAPAWAVEDLCSCAKQALGKNAQNPSLSSSCKTLFIRSSKATDLAALSSLANLPTCTTQPSGGLHASNLETKTLKDRVDTLATASSAQEQRIKEAQEKISNTQQSAHIATAIAIGAVVLAVVEGVFLLRLAKAPQSNQISSSGGESMNSDKRIENAERDAKQALAATTEMARNIEQLQNRQRDIETLINKSTRYDTVKDSKSETQPMGRKTTNIVQEMTDSKVRDPLVTAYNEAATSRKSADHIRFESAYPNVAFFTVANARDRAQNRDLAADFRTAEAGPYFAVPCVDGSYSVFPSLGKYAWGLRRDAAMSEVFDFPDVLGEPDLGVRKPAKFQRDGEEWTRIDRGILESLERG